MHFTTEQGDSKTIFRLKEERLDSRNAGQLKAEFLILSQPDIDALIVDLSDVQHIDSAGISALLLAQRQMKIHDGEVRLVGLTAPVRSMIGLTQLDRVFPIFATVEEAASAEMMHADDDLESEAELPESEFDEDEDLQLSFGSLAAAEERSLGPSAPSAKDIKAGAIAAGGSFGAAALAKIMMTPYDDEMQSTTPAAFGNAMGSAFESPILGDDEDFEDDDEEFDDDEDLEEDELGEDELDEDDEEGEDLDEEDDLEDVEDEDLAEDDEFEDDDFDDEELEEDEDEDY